MVPYQVRLAIIEDLLRQPDDAVLDGIVKRQAAAVAEHDDWFADEIAEGHPSLGDALRGLVIGQMVDDAGYAYAYALEALCREYGTELPNEQVYPIGSLEDFDEALTAAGVSAPLPTVLTAFDPPVPIPPPADFPGIGTVRATACSEAAARYEAALPALADTDWDLASAAMAGWFRSCADADADLVVFFY
jgi:hypothetical protein